MSAVARPAILLAAALAACTATEPPPTVDGGDPERGRLQLEQYACGSCHVVPGVRQAHGTVGPSLGQYARRVYVAGEIPNQPDILVRFIADPQEQVPGTLMPDLGVPEAHARDMGAYLMSLR